MQVLNKIRNISKFVKPLDFKKKLNISTTVAFSCRNVHIRKLRNRILQRIKNINKYTRQKRFNRFYLQIFAVKCQNQNDNRRPPPKEDKKQEEFTCPEATGSGNFADPATCRRFYQVGRV